MQYTKHILETSGREIQILYDKFNFKHGWTLLYSPMAAFNSSTRLMFFGLNPGGTGENVGRLSCEDGNAYFIESWGKSREGYEEKSLLQRQIFMLYESIAHKLHPPLSALELAQFTLAANFIPFRSRDWASLPNKKDVAQFSMKMWSTYFDVIHPKVIICMGVIPSNALVDILKTKQYSSIAHYSGCLNWGNTKWQYLRMKRDEQQIVVIVLPHLSRFRVFGRPQSLEAVEQITDCIANELST